MREQERGPWGTGSHLLWVAESLKRLTKPLEGGLRLRVPEGLGDVLGPECLTSSQVMLALAQGPHLENSDSKVTENLAPWSLEEMTGELESAQCATASFDILYTHKNPQADLHQ